MHIEVDSHTHTIASGHAYSTLAENIQAAAARGIKLLAITDHGPQMPGAPHFWYFMNMRVIPRILHGVGILRGIEANIVNIKGELDIDAAIEEQLDIVLGSLHEPIITPTTKNQHTEAVIQAMASGRIDVFAHGGNPAFPIDVDEVAKTAAHYNVLVEINNSSFTTSRKGSMKNCAALATAVARHNGYLTFGSDAHIAEKVGGFEECIKFIRTVGVEESRVLSQRGATFLDFLKSKNKKTDLSEFATLF
ncbi:phosphatase [Desulforhopalus sp. IMCC35007]|uniref:phosphatase n=1 Tax=Desulforhopalus sp. IMCC35007 TaxID=2569543 RepID=UPI0010AECC55|nr:phosphatase [Desulforhopalus sp. IMCC35007]TKB11624.1 phosphatase [Desulforhopalus sp. IMCC35007]